MASDQLGEYRIRRKLASGGMGTALLAEDRAGRRVVVKVIRPEFANDPVFRARFAAEVAAARKVPRFCTAPVIDADLDGDVLYVVTEYVNGPTLQALVADRGPLPPGELEGVAAGIAAALTAIHDAGIIHRDLKPGNVLLSLFGPRVIDFGIARAAAAVDGPTATGLVLGTPGFMAPEQFRDGHLTPALDVFAWGAVIAYAATGDPPFGRATDWMALAYRVVHEQPNLDGLHSPLRDLVERAMRKDPTQRPAARQLLDALVGNPGAASVLTHATETPTAASPAELPAPPPAPETAAEPAGLPAGLPPAAGEPQVRRSRRGLALAAAAAAVAAVLGGVSYLALSSTPDHHGKRTPAGSGDGRHGIGVHDGASTSPSAAPTGTPGGTPTGTTTSGTRPTAGTGPSHQATTDTHQSVKLPSPTKSAAHDRTCIGYVGIPLQGGASGSTADIQVCVWVPKCGNCIAERGEVSWATHASALPSTGRINFRMAVYTCAGALLQESGNPLNEAASVAPTSSVQGNTYDDVNAPSFYADLSVSQFDMGPAGRTSGTLSLRTDCRTEDG